MRSFKFILPVMLLVTLVAPLAQAAAVEEVIITGAYTTDQYMDDASEFCVFDPIMFHVDYTISGEAGKSYKAIIIIRYRGERLRTVERHKPGSYTTTMVNTADGDVIGTHTVTYKIKLRQKGTLADISDPETSEITVSECLE